MYRFIPIMLLCVCLFTGGCSKIRELHRRFPPCGQGRRTFADGASSDLDIISSVYNYIITHFTYDYSKASSVTSGYLPDIDEVFSPLRKESVLITLQS